jgi:hypothetical protein
VWVLEDWWPTIRDLTLCWEFCSEQHSKRQYERWNKILYGQQWRKKEKSQKFLRIEDFIFYLSPRNSVLSRGCIGWVGEVQNIKIYLTTKISCQARHIRLLGRIPKALAGHVRPSPLPWVNHAYPTPYPGSRDLTRTCLARSVDISGLLVLSNCLSGFQWPNLDMSGPQPKHVLPLSLISLLIWVPET